MSFFGMTKTVMRSLFSRPATHLYPFEEKRYFPGSRGRIAIRVEACVFCGLCAKKCPTAALAVNRETKTWTIDRLRCVTCNYCVEVCPKKCLAMQEQHGVPTVTKDREMHAAPKPET